jgi:hypothetical protein
VTRPMARPPTAPATIPIKANARVLSSKVPFPRLFPRFDIPCSSLTLNAVYLRRKLAYSLCTLASIVGF